jgi:hypothetical protein
MARSIIVSISIAQVRRLGWLRCLVGGGCMYLTVPAFIVLNVTLVLALYQWIVRPLVGTARVRWADHVILDRMRIEGLLLLDRVNCQFCAYANGLSTMMNTELDHLSQFSGRLSWWKQPIVALAVLVSWPVWIAFDLYAVRLVYGVGISRPLRMLRLSYSDAASILRRAEYGAQFGWLPRVTLRLWKNTALAMSMALEQIESAWCPLRHFEAREGIVYPEHHKNFLGASSIEDLRKARDYLRARGGTVSPRRPEPRAMDPERSA